MRNRYFDLTKTVILLAVLVFSVAACSAHFLQIRRAELLYKEGQTFLSEGKGEDAVLKFQESLSLAREAGFQAGVAHNLNEMAIYHSARGEQEKARQLLGEALDIYTKANMEPEVSKSLNNMALTYLRQADFNGALTIYEKLLKWDRDTGNLLGVGITLNNMGLIYANHLSQRAEAQKRYTNALQIFRQLGQEKYIQAVEKNLRD